jgi:predicted pyridoxine 5'-phosphate oxidase superfamily flavin-nucleotide-binding protein
MDRIASVAELEATVGARALPALLKSIDALDAHCERILAASPFAVLGWSDADGRTRASALGGAPGFARAEGAHRLRVPAPSRVAPRPGSGAALLCFVPGLGETLRINGRAAPDGELGIEVEEAFVHCAKALIRSALWRGGAAAPAPAPGPPPSAGPLADPALRGFLARAPFVVLASHDAAGSADVSPKGDPPGFVQVLSGDTLALPDRPGNRRTDTFHNLLDEPRLGLLALAPGDPRVLEASGSASLTRDPALLATMAVQGKTPKLALLLRVAELRLAESPALADARLWDASSRALPAALPPMARVLADHVKQNKRRGVAAATLRTLVSERTLGPALERDYEKGLY